MQDLTANARIRVHRPASDVFEAFVNPDVMTRFWFPRASGRLEAGRDVTWHVGTDPDAVAITVRVLTVEAPHALHFLWGAEGAFTDVRWSFESVRPDETVVRVRESGFPGSEAEAVAAALDSTGGFNQVLVAAKAWLEHGVRINVVEDHVA